MIMKDIFLKLCAIFFNWFLMAVRDCCPRSLVSNIQVPSSPNNACEYAGLCHVSVCV